MQGLLRGVLLCGVLDRVGFFVFFGVIDGVFFGAFLGEGVVVVSS